MEEEKKKTIDSKKLSKIAVVIMIAVIVILGGTFAWLRIGLNGSNTNKVKAGLLDLIVDETPTSTDVVRLERAVPQSYRQGLTNAPYRFTLVNNSTIDTDYTLTLQDLYEGADANLTSSDKIADSLIRYILVKNDDELVATNSKLLSTGRTIDSGTIAGKVGNEATTIPYTLYIWIDSMAGDDGTQANIMDKIFSARLSVTAEQHHETTPAQVGFQPTYFAFGTPTTSDTTRPSGKNVYAGMDASGNKGVCINRSGTEYCFQANNVAYEQQHVQEVFSDITCDSGDDGVSCGADDFGCDVPSDGDVDCYDYGTSEYCYVNSDGDVLCD